MRVLALFVLLLSLVAAPSAMSADRLAGTITRLKGTAQATLNNFTRPLSEDMEIFVGERIVTGAATRIQIRMIDGAMITLGDNTAITIDVYNNDLGRAAMEVTNGVFLATSGAIAKYGPDRFIMKTPSAVLGIRGTTVWGQQQPDHLAVVMLSGTSVTITTENGAVVLSEPKDGTDAIAGRAPTQPKTWGAKRIAASAALVSFE